MDRKVEKKQYNLPLKDMTDGQGCGIADPRPGLVRHTSVEEIPGILDRIASARRMPYPPVRGSVIRRAKMEDIDPETGELTRYQLCRPDGTPIS